jgi:Fibronectin type III domain
VGSSRMLRILIAGAMATAGAVVVAGPTTAAHATVIPVFMNVPATGLTVSGYGSAANLYAWASCGGEFAPAKPQIEVVNPAIASPPVAFADLNHLYESATCDGLQSVGENIAVWGSRLYEITREGWVETASNSRSDTPHPTYQLNSIPPLIDGGIARGIAVDDHAITWTDSTSAGMGVFSAGAPLATGSFAGPRRVYDSDVPLRHLTAGPFGTRFVVRGSGAAATLIGLTPNAGSTGYSPTTLSTGQVTAVASDPGAVYWAEKLSNGYAVYTRRVSASRTGAITFGSVTSLARVTGLAGTARISHLVTDPNTAIPATRHDLWWSVEGTTNANDATLVHLSRALNTRLVLLRHSDTTDLDDIATDGNWVYWTDSVAVHRALSSATAPPPVTTPISTSDVSPDLPYAHGVSCCDDPGGRVTDLVVDPTNGNNLYAATQYSGPWRSTDAGRSWRQSANGLADGGTDDSSKIAIDPTAPTHLLYATDDDGSIADGSSAALYASTDSGSSWGQVDPGQVPCQVYFLAFAAGTAWASGACGIYKSSDLFNWTHVTTTGTPHAGAFITATGGSVFACDDTNVTYTRDDGTSWHSVVLPHGHCISWSAFPLAVAASSGDPNQAIVLHEDSDTTPIGLTQLNLTTGVGVELGYPNVPRDSKTNRVAVSGEVAVWIANTHSGGNRVFAANGDNYFEWGGGTTWNQFSDAHIDARALAFPSSYDPAHGNCRAYVANDGSVAVDQTVHADGSPCTTHDGPWVRAQHGLHAYKSSVINGVHRASCENSDHVVVSPCPVLYVGSGDNGMWTRDLTQATPWDNMHDCCGDNGGVTIDPRLPHQVLATRNGTLQQYDNGGDYVRSTTGGSNLAPPHFADPTFPPSPSGETTVMSTSSVPAHDTQIALEHVPSPGDPNPDNPTNGWDQLVISRNGGGWTNIGPHLGLNSVAQLASSGGNGSGLVVYLRRADGSVQRATVSTTNQLGTLTTVSPPDANVSIMWANPYNVNELWIENDALHEIERSSTDGTFTWIPAPDLTSFAVNFDARFATTSYSFGHINTNELPVNSLQYMWFPSDGSGTRIALTPYGGPAISRDSGATWIPLGPSLPLGSWLAHPWSFWYDAYGSNGVTSDLYLALAGRGVQRLNANFDALVDVTYTFCPGGTCPGAAAAAPLAVSTVPKDVAVVDESENRTIPMALDTDGNWRATELLDATGRGQLHYHFVVDGVAQPPVTEVLSAKQRRTGIVNALPPYPSDPNPDLPQVGALTASQQVIPGPTCTNQGQKIDVSVPISATGGAPATSATLTVLERSYDDIGDPQTSVASTVPLTPDLANASNWTGSFQIPDLANNAGISAPPALILQVSASAVGGTSLGSPLTLSSIACPKPGSKPPTAPQQVSAKTARGGISVSWAKPNSTGGSPIIGYEIAAYHQGSRIGIEQFNASLRTGLFTGLKAKAGYAFEVRAATLAGDGPWSKRTGVVTAA